VERLRESYRRFVQSDRRRVERALRRDGVCYPGLLRGRTDTAAGHRRAVGGTVVRLPRGSFDSFDLPLGPARYLQLMNPVLPDGETVWSRLGLFPHGRAMQTIDQRWPKVRADIEGGHPSPLGLVTVKSTNPLDLKLNHQASRTGTSSRATGSRSGCSTRTFLAATTRPCRSGSPTRPSGRSPRCGGTVGVIAFFRTSYPPKTHRRNGAAGHDWQPVSGRASGARFVTHRRRAPRHAIPPTRRRCRHRPVARRGLSGASASRAS